MEDLRDRTQLDAKICAAALMPIGGGRAYHGFTRGFLVDGILRRVDSHKRSIGRFIQDEICGPLGVSYYCGMTAEMVEKHQIAQMHPRPKVFPAGTLAVGSRFPPVRDLVMLWYAMVPALVGSGGSLLSSGRRHTRWRLSFFRVSLESATQSSAA